MALTNEELKEMETALKKAFANVCNCTDSFDGVTSLATTIQARLAVDKEITRRGLNGPHKPGDC